MVAPNVIQAPPARPPRYGLLAAAETITDETPGRWPVAGVTYAPEQCGNSGRVGTGCSGTDELDPDGNPPAAVGQPFVVWAADRCSTFGFLARDYAGRARRQLEATQSYEVANELWTGELSAADGLDNHVLTDPTSDTLTAGPADVVDALAMLDQGLAQCAKGRRGMIHLTVQALDHLVARQAVYRDGNQFVTAVGTILVADAGYTGSGPGDTVGAGQWAYATGLVQVYLAGAMVLPDNFDQAIDRRRNVVTLYAEREAMFVWDGCCHLAAEVNLPLPLIGGAS